MKKLSVLLPVVVAGLYLGGGFAHADAVKAANGGQVQDAGGNHWELVVVKANQQPLDNPVLVYLTDGTGKKLATAGATGTAMLLAGKDKTVVTLAPDGDNRMKGVGNSYGFAHVSTLGKFIEDGAGSGNRAGLEAHITEYGEYLSKVQISYE